jgi:RNA polymerase sigma-70 factor (ECF subfamily)
MRAGDQSAVAELAAVYGQRIFKLAFRYTRNREDAEEVTQDVLLKVYRKIDAFRGESALSSWMYRITFNTVMSRLRNSKASRAAELRAEDTRRPARRDAAGRARPRPDPADGSPLADEELLRAQLRQRIAHALSQLPEIYRVPVVLRDIHGLSTHEASAVLRVNNQTLKSRLHRGRTFLRDRLAEFTGGLSLHRPAALPVPRGTGLLSAA